MVEFLKEKSTHTSTSSPPISSAHSSLTCTPTFPVELRSPGHWNVARSSQFEIPIHFQPLLNLCNICFPWISFPWATMTPFFPGFCPNPFLTISQPPLLIFFLYLPVSIGILHNSTLTFFFLIILNTTPVSFLYQWLCYHLYAANCQIYISRFVLFLELHIIITDSWLKSLKAPQVSQKIDVLVQFKEINYSNWEGKF